MARTSKLQYTASLLLVVFLLIGLYWKLSSFYKCLQNGTRESGNVALPMKVMFPASFISEKVDLSIGILCHPDEWFVDDVIKSIKSIIDQIENTEEVETYIVFVGILSSKKDEIARVKKQFAESSILEGVQVTFIFVDKDRLRIRFDSEDTAPAYYLESKEFVEVRGHVNMLLAVLYWHASQASQYFLLTDARYTLNNGALSKFIKEFESKGGIDKLLRITNVKVEGIFGTLYGCNKALMGLAEFLYWLSPYQDIDDLMRYYEHLLSSHVKVNTETSMFSFHQISVPGTAVENNPVAMVTTNMKVVEEYFPTNPYERGELFWTSTATKGSFIIIKFVQAIKIKHIRIDTGKNIYFSDALTKAVLEEAEQFHDNDCGPFHQIGDFRSSRVNMDLSGRKKHTSCLRIRLLADQGHWMGIRLIKVST